MTENTKSPPIEGDRTATQTGTPGGNARAIRGIVVLAAVVFMGFGWWSFSRSEKQDAVAPKTSVTRPDQSFEKAREAPQPPAAAIPAAVQPGAIEGATPEKPATDELLDAARRAPVMAFGGGKTTSNTNRAANPPASSGQNYLPPDGLGGMTSPRENEDQRFNRMLTPTVLEGSRAGYLGNRNYIVAMGTSIPCVLETALSSDQPGFTSCIVNRDVLSDNGRVVLMEKGTQIVGEYRGGLRRGQNRLFVLWSRAKTPKGVIVTLASPATDAIGRAGFDGYVDTHWWERFGSALLLSVVGDLTSYAGSQLQGTGGAQGGGGFSAQDTTSAGKQAAAIAVEQSINIPPTLMKHQGSLVSIFVARDLDFSSIYGLRVTEPRTTIYDRAVTGDFEPHDTIITK